MQPKQKLGFLRLFPCELVEFLKAVSLMGTCVLQEPCHPPLTAVEGLNVQVQTHEEPDHDEWVAGDTQESSAASEPDEEEALSPRVRALTRLKSRAQERRLASISSSISRYSSLCFPINLQPLSLDGC